MTFVNGTLLHSGMPVPAVCHLEALADFLQFLSPYKPCVLVAHNCRAFDSRVLLFHLKDKHMLSAFKEICDGFADSMLLFQSLYPDRRKSKLGYKQVNLCDDLLAYTYDAHNSLADVVALQKLCSLVHVKELFCHSFSVTFVSDSLAYAAEKKKNLRELYPMIEQKVISRSMAEKIAGSGLGMPHLKLAYKRNPENGIHALCTECFDGKPRVTRKSVIISAIEDYIGALPEFKGGVREA